MKKLIAATLVLLVAYYGYELSPPTQGPVTPSSQTASDRIEPAFDQRLSGQQVRGSGIVSRILSDDNNGSRHQRFILRLPSGQTLLVAHNIDLAPRIASLQAGDSVSFFGVYEWNDKGGVIHWTHADPAGRHIAGWIEHNGVRYQ
jgi:hypothetical protein